MNSILSCAKFISEHSEMVKIDENKALAFAREFTEKNVKHWFDQSPVDISRLSKSERLNFLLVFNALSFSYWGTPKWTIQYQGKELDGAYGMMTALFRGIEEGNLELSPNFLSKINRAQLSHILRGNTEIPLLTERLKNINECGIGLSSLGHEELSDIIQASENDAMTLLEKVVSTFPTFDDHTTFKGQKCTFHKRAQLLISDISNVFKNDSIGKLKNIDQLTGLADYKIPQILREKEILVYSKSLSDLVDKQVPLKRNSNEENEIRGNTVYAIEKITNEVKKNYPSINSMHVNDHLWLETQIKHPKWRPYHLVRTTAY